MDTPQQLVTAAASDLRAAEDLLQTGDTAWACSAAAEAGRKSLEAVAAYIEQMPGDAALPGLVRSIATRLETTSPKLEQAAAVLDRYTNIAELEAAEPPSAPEAKAALAAARQILELAKGILGMA